MSQCWNEGNLRAYLDRELPPEEMAAAALHLAACAECHGAYNRIAARSARVAALMSALDAPLAPSAPAVRAPVRWNRALPVAALALAAAVAAAFVLVPRQKANPVVHPVVAPHTAPAANRLQLAQSPADASPIESVAPSRTALSRPRVRHAAARSQTDYYLALDDQPIETGYIMRLELDGQEADVIVDDTGKPRAIRPVNTK